MSEWKCPNCDDMEGTYQELRAAGDRGVDQCHQCSSEVECIDEDEQMSRHQDEIETIIP